MKLIKNIVSVGPPAAAKVLSSEETDCLLNIINKLFVAGIQIEIKYFPIPQPETNS